jgi:hypothetical protein
LEKVSKAGYFANVWSLHLDFEKKRIEDALTLEDLGRFLHFCPKLTDLTIQMDESRQNELKSQRVELAMPLSQGFSRLEHIKFDNCLRGLFRNSWPCYQEILT